MNSLRHILPCLLAALAGPVAVAAEAPRLTWQVSPDRRSLWLAWDDPTGIRAVVEASHDLKHWFFVEGFYRPWQTNLVFHTYESPAGPRHPEWASYSRAYRVLSVPPLREGRVIFGNRIVSAGINAPVTFLGDLRPGSPAGGARLADGQFLAQLMVEIPGLYRGPVGEAVPFRSGTSAGFVPNTAVSVPVPDTTKEVRVSMVAWWSLLGATYGEATTRSIGLIGQSLPVTVRPALEPDAEATPLAGLQPFSIAAIL